MKRAMPARHCGTWVSPLSAAQVAAGGVRLSQPCIAGEWTYWLESRPAENGRSVLVRGRPGENSRDLTPPPFSVRSRVHEYGGGAYAVGKDAIFFVNDAGQQIYRQTLDSGMPNALCDVPNCRFADLLADEHHQRLICVCEDHTNESDEAVNSLVAVDSQSGVVTTLANGYDFYSSPCVSADGRQLVWLCWNHPQMPWEGCELWLAELDGDGIPGRVHCVAGGAQESIFQPQFAPDGTLHFVSDRGGFWNIYKYADGKVQAVTRDSMDYGFAQWNFGMSSYGFTADGTLFATRVNQGGSELVSIGNENKLRFLDSGFTQIEHLHVDKDQLVILAGNPIALPALYIGDGKHLTALTHVESAIPAEFISSAESIRFPTTDGETAQAWYYPPRNPHYSVSDGEKPPLIVKCHGGPTAMNGNGLEPRIQFWTSRGFAVADVNYRGSSGFGRAYRRSLRGQWGIKDVEDCLHAARYLVKQGWADGQRLAISGSSAGGFTVLCALTFHDVFKAAAVYYGISELQTAMRDTHKFEAHYGDGLLGPWPEAQEIYRVRSPLYVADHIVCPVIFFQGLKDRVVPPDQTERMVNALRARTLPVAYMSFPEEGHGFRRRETLQQSLEAELAFYARVFGFTPADALPPLAIDNLAEQA